MTTTAPRLLLIEDNADDALFLKSALTRAAVTVDLHVAEDGEAGLAYLREHASPDDPQRPQIVLLDLNLPRLDGHEVLRRVKDDPELCDIVVIVLTTSASPTDVARALRGRANAYVTKPPDFVSFQELVSALETFWFRTATLMPG